MTIGTSAQTYDIYISDAGNFNNPPWQIVKFDQNGENPEVFIDQELAWPQDILFIEDQGIVLISNLSNGKISRYDAETGDYIDDFATGINGPTRMKVGSDGLLYVLQWSGTSPVLRYQLDGTYVDEYTDAGVNQSIGIDWDAEGSLYISSYGGGKVQEFDGSGIDQGAFISSNLAGPTNVWFQDSGDLMVVDYNGGTVDHFDGDGNYIGPFMTGLSQPEGVAFLPNGDILIGNGGNGSVKRFDSDGIFIEDIIPAGSGNLLTPNAVVLRENALGLGESITSAEEVLVNSVGRVFTIMSELVEQLDSIEVLDTSGRSVYRSNITDEVVWKAASVSKGIYTLILFKEGEAIHSQKILVEDK
ncbi:MAG: hypothetical protein HKN45_04745 [Flavobacteriales bacterium]|nr:hypothetical protein [Flavobacteriales bacterium]